MTYIYLMSASGLLGQPTSSIRERGMRGACKQAYYLRTNGDHHKIIYPIYESSRNFIMYSLYKLSSYLVVKYYL